METWRVNESNTSTSFSRKYRFGLIWNKYLPWTGWNLHVRTTALLPYITLWKRHCYLRCWQGATYSSMAIDAQCMPHQDQCPVAHQISKWNCTSDSMALKIHVWRCCQSTDGQYPRPSRTENGSWFLWPQNTLHGYTQNSCHISGRTVPLDPTK